MNWENDAELKEMIEKEYEINTGFLNEKTGKDIRVTPEVEIDQDEDEIILQYQIFHQAGDRKSVV